MFFNRKKSNDKPAKENVKSFSAWNKPDFNVSATLGDNRSQVMSAFQQALDNFNKGDKSVDVNALIHTAVISCRELATSHIANRAVTEIVNEAICYDDTSLDIVDIDFSKAIEHGDINKTQANKLEKIFNDMLARVQFGRHASALFRNFYIDGRLHLYLAIDDKKQKEGIKQLILLDPLNFESTEFVELSIDKLNRTEYNISKSQIKHSYHNSLNGDTYSDIPDYHIASAYSGITDESGSVYLSHLSRSIIPFNALRILEDASVIYRFTRSPSRLLWLIDTDKIAPSKIQEYVKKIVSAFKTKEVYDPKSGKIDSQKAYRSITEDIFLPQSSTKSTDVKTLSGDNRGSDALKEIEYFNKEFIKSLNVPATRWEDGGRFYFGREGEISREEITFAKFINQLLMQFSDILYDMMALELEARDEMPINEFNKLKQWIRFSWNKDNFYAELKDLELLRERADAYSDLRDLIGNVITKETALKVVFGATNIDIDAELEAIKNNEGDDNASKNSKNRR